jgi:hypothetical protein
VEEDRGAFKTNLREPSRIKHFVIDASPGNTRIRAGFVRHFGPFGGHFISRFSSPRMGADCCILDSARFAAANAANSVVTAFPEATKAFAMPA